MPDNDSVRELVFKWLVLTRTADKLYISYKGTMGSSMYNVNHRLELSGLFDMEQIYNCPSFSESGSPDDDYEASVDLSDLSDEMMLRLDNLFHKMTSSKEPVAAVPPIVQ